MGLRRRLLAKDLQGLLQVAAREPIPQAPWPMPLVRMRAGLTRSTWNQTRQTLSVPIEISQAESGRLLCESWMRTVDPLLPLSFALPTTAMQRLLPVVAAASTLGVCHVAVIGPAPISPAQ